MGMSSRVSEAAVLVADDADVVVDLGREPRSEGSRYVIRYESPYHLFAECDSLRRAERTQAMRRSEALAEGHLMCGLCRSRLSRALSAGRDDDAFFASVESGAEAGSDTFVLHGSYEQTLLVSAERWAMGSGGAMERLVRSCVERHVGDMSASTAHLLAREIREWWCDWVWPEGCMYGLGRHKDDVCDWIGLLPALDERTAHAMPGNSYEPTLPTSALRAFNRIGESAWDRLPEEVRPRFVGRLEPVGETHVELVGKRDQAALVAASRYCFGRSSYMPSLTCDVLRRNMSGMCVDVAARIALDVRMWWLDSFAFDWPLVGRELSFSTVSCWLELLDDLDGHAGFALMPECGTIEGWDEAHDFVRPKVPVR